MSRLTGLPEGAAPDAGKLPPFYFRDLGEAYLLTNDWGHHVTLPRADFKRFLEGRLKADEAVFAELRDKGFVKTQMDFQALARDYHRKNGFHYIPGPSLHMMVVTLRCNQKCLYCHSSVVDPSRTDTDMDLDTAKRTVDFIFSTPNPSVCIEFQGGEPLLNWPVVKFVTRYARMRARAAGRKAIVALVSNFTLMTDERMDFLLDEHVSICTSLDGPADIHDRNRPFLGSGLPHAKVVGWLEKLGRQCADGSRKHYLPGALMTTTRFSLGRGRDIVDVYTGLGLEQIFLRPLSPIGYAKRVWGEIGYRPEEFVRFYEDTLDYIIELNASGKSQIMERMALICLTKILKREDPGFMDLRSPAGAVLGCLAYNYNGEIFVSDEGRMVDHQGDPIFRVGDVFHDRWQDVLDHPTTRACVTASVLENQPMCSQCAYKPYCGAEPVFHYETQRSVFGQMPSSAWCAAHMGLFDVLFRKLRDPKARAVFEDWMRRDQCRWQENDLAIPGQPVEAAK